MYQKIDLLPTISDIIIGPIAQKRKQSPPPPCYNVVSAKAMTILSCIVLYHAANILSNTCSNIETGEGVFYSNFARLYSKIVFRCKCPKFQCH